MNGLIRCEEGGSIYRWRATTLWNAVQHRSPQNVPLLYFEKTLDRDLWFQQYEVPTLRNIMRHYERIQRADLRYPIILSPQGAVLDGTHRIIKALTQGHTSILVVYLDNYPPSDYEEDTPFLAAHMGDMM